MRSTTGFGMRAGPEMPYQTLPSTCGYPASARLGKSGYLEERWLPTVAIGLIRPDWMCGKIDGSESKASCTLPAARSTTPGPLPLYGTCTIGAPVAALNISPTRGGMPPLPDE